MKILFLQDGFLPEDLSGPAMVVFNLAKELQKLGHQIYIITTTRDKSKASQSEYQGLKVFRIYSEYHERWRAYLGLCNPQTIYQVKKIIKQIKPDIVHAHNIHYYLSYYCLKIAKKYSQAVFLTAHDVMSFHYSKLIEFINPNDLSIPKTFNYKINAWEQVKRFKKRYNPFRNIIIKHYLKNVDKIFPVSFALKEVFKQNRIKNTEVIYNGINVDEWQIQNNKIEEFKKKYNLLNKEPILFIGRLSGLKGGKQLIKAMGQVIKQVPKSVLLVVGEKNDYIKKMIQLAKKYNVLLIFTGHLERDQVKLVYQSSKIVIVPSICFDAFPTVNLESMASKKPVIGTCFGGSSEAIQDNLTGYIVNPFNTKELSNKILDLLNDLEKSKKFGENGFERIKNKFSIKKQTEKTLEWYKKYV